MTSPATFGSPAIKCASTEPQINRISAGKLFQAAELFGVPVDAFYKGAALR